jgi:hypothetical protein
MSSLFGSQSKISTVHRIVSSPLNTYNPLGIGGRFFAALSWAGHFHSAESIEEPEKHLFSVPAVIRANSCQPWRMGMRANAIFCKFLCIRNLHLSEAARTLDKKSFKKPFTNPGRWGIILWSELM